MCHCVNAAKNLVVAHSFIVHGSASKRFESGEPIACVCPLKRKMSRENEVHSFIHHDLLAFHFSPRSECTKTTKEDKKNYGERLSLKIEH